MRGKEEEEEEKEKEKRRRRNDEKRTLEKSREGAALVLLDLAAPVAVA